MSGNEQDSNGGYQNAETELSADGEQLDGIVPSAGGAADENDNLVTRLESELEEMKDKYLRALAELENFKRRSLKERSDLVKYQGEKIFVDLLDIIDNFDLALNSPQGDGEQFRKGVELIYKLFQDFLAKWEVRGESAIGRPFDPEKHNAISRLRIEGKEPGTVVQELKKAYIYKDKIVRFGEVVVAAE